MKHMEMTCISQMLYWCYLMMLKSLQATLQTEFPPLNPSNTCHRTYNLTVTYC